MPMRILQQTRRYSAFLLPLPVLAGLAVFFFATAARDENNSITHTLVVELSLERLLFDLDEAETNQRGYFLTNERQFVEPYQAAAALASKDLQSLKMLTADNPRQQQALAQLRPLVQNKLDHMRENVEMQVRGGVDSAVRESRTDAGKMMMDAIHKMISEMRSEEDRLLAQRQIDFGRAARSFTWSFVVAGLVVCVVIGAFYRAIARGSRAVGDLNAALEQRVHDRTSRLQASEVLQNTFVQHVPAAVAMLDREMRYLRVSDRWCTDYSLTSQQMLGRSHYEIFPDIPERWKQIHRRGLAGESLREEEDCWDRADGTRTWLHWEIRPWGDRNGEPEGILIFSEDITSRKRMEEALRKSEQELRALAGSLLTAQEDERRRIARDLHDDVTQRLASLSIEIGKLAGGSSGATSECLRGLQSQVSQISREVRRVSHGLHPSVIEDFGLTTALEEFCEEFSTAQGIPVRLSGLVRDARLTTQTASCLFRIAQESVQNAVKHGGATQIRISLDDDGQRIQLCVSDNGAGFASGTGRAGLGLGIISMKERMRLVNGGLSITSRPGQGTEIIAIVPLSGDSHAKATNSAG